jgi:hypothetical protein
MIKTIEQFTVGGHQKTLMSYANKLKWCILPIYILQLLHLF